MNKENRFLRFFKRAADRVTNEITEAQNEIKLGNQLLQQNRFAEAKSVFQKYIEKYPNRPQGYEGLSSVALRTWQRETAYNWLDISIKRTKSKSSYMRKASLLANHAQFEEGFRVVDELVKVHGMEAGVQLFKAELLFKPKRFSEAVDLLKGSDQNLSTQILLARALIGAKRYKEASEEIEKFQMDSKPENEKTKTMFWLLACWQKYYLNGTDFDQPKIFGLV